MSLGGVASKRRLVQARAMFVRGVSWLKLILPMSRRDRARLAQLDKVRADLATIADCVHDIASRQDAHAHQVRKMARASRGAMTETRGFNSTQNLLLGQAADAVVRSKQAAKALDDVAEALERVAASLRDG